MARTIQYLSPSGIDTYRKDKEEYYLRYLAECRPPREPQTVPMAIGSAFDCYVKSYISNHVFGKGAKQEYDFESMFEKAVEEPARTRARIDGALVFDLYKSCGALGDLIIELETASDIRMEFEVKGTVLIQRPGGVTLLGKPDLSFISKSGRHILLDWKVNGAYSTYKTSPMRGYMKCRAASGVGTQPHKDCVPAKLDGIRYNNGIGLETLNPSWAQQLSIYAWLCGQQVGGQFLVAIDQIVGQLGAQRVAEHRLLVDPSWQAKLAGEIDEIWEIVNSNHFFRELSLEDSQGRCKLLDDRAHAIYGSTIEENEMWDSAKPKARMW